MADRFHQSGSELSPHAPLILILGGRRSGKSAFAESLAPSLAPEGVYVATAGAHDEEMRERIRAHQARRGGFWRTIEEELALASVISAEAAPHRVVLVDCLTLFVSNLMHHGRDIELESRLLIEQLRSAKGPVVLVANEVGLGIVPGNALARQFSDHAGRLNQSLAQAADTVVFVAAGLPLMLKGSLSLPSIEG